MRGQQLENVKLKPKIVDLFCGAGGLSLGAARAGFNVCCAIDLDSEALTAHHRNFPNSIHRSTDISSLTGQVLLESFANQYLDGIIGGPPCQGFSPMGKRNKYDKRNRLFIDFFRIVSEARPKFFMAENVPGILNELNDEIRNKAFDYVKKDYILLEPMTLAASDYGAPTIRKRVFFIGYLRDEMNPLMDETFKPAADVETVKVKDALLGLPNMIKPGWQTEEQGWRIVHADGKGNFASRLHGHIPAGVGNPVALERLKKQSRASGCLGTVHSREVAERYGNIECGKSDPISKSYKLDPEGFCPTLRAGTGPDKGSFQAVRPLHPTQNRVITPREAARLQGFPDWYQFAPTKWHSFRQIGSSVSPIISEAVLSSIFNSVIA
jgi:DNA (cytosine-5)-methyltransferase 1